MICRLQLVWAVLMTNGTVSVNGTFKSPADSRPKPYLRSLGLSNSLTALVWVAGPLCGTIIQPLVGVHSDQCTSSWGRRRPYIVVGACCTLFCILALAFTKEMVECVAYLAGFEDHQDAIKTTTMVIAVIWVWALNIMAQPLQSGIRALIIDRCPAHQQVEASSWASRFSGLGSVFTCAMGFTYLPSWIPFGKTQFRSLAGIAAVALMITVSLNCYFIREDRLQHTKSGETKRSSAKAIFKRLLNVSKTMPPRARSVCKIQFLSWMGWFPFLFYATTYVSTNLSLVIYSHRHRYIGDLCRCCPTILRHPLIPHRCRNSDDSRCIMDARGNGCHARQGHTSRQLGDDDIRAGDAQCQSRPPALPKAISPASVGYTCRSTNDPIWLYASSALDDVSNPLRDLYGMHLPGSKLPQWHRSLRHCRRELGFHHLGSVRLDRSRDVRTQAPQRGLGALDR